MITSDSEPVNSSNDEPNPASNNSHHNGQNTPAGPLTTQPFPASRKLYLNGIHHDIRVPVREITLSTTDGINGAQPSQNQPVVVYDTSGPYTDPDITINAKKGLYPIRREWILNRNDVEQLSDVTSTYGQKRAADPSLQPIRFALSPKTP